VRSELEDRLRTGDHVKLIPYLMAGFPDHQRFLDAAHRLLECDIGALEIGIPFSDPLADGPVIQHAGQVALEQGMTVARCLELASRLGAQQSRASLVVMTYVNPVLAYGVKRFAADASAAGVTGVIVPDLPVEEAHPVCDELRRAGLDTIFLVTPTSTDERIAAATGLSAGFVYCVTVTGITGVRRELPASLDGLLRRVRARTQLPIAAGFGISRPEHLAALRGRADAAVVGSALVRELAEGRDPAQLVTELQRAA
jgi:tryptophan synthase alpha chain